MDKLRSILDAISAKLTGEPARAIGYGAAVAVVAVVYVANALGFTRFGASLSLADALSLASVSITFVVGIVEGIRHYVFSPNTVAEVVAAQVTPAVSGVPADDAEVVITDPDA